MSQPSLPVDSGGQARTRAFRVLARVTVLAALAALAVFIATQGRSLLGEWRKLRGEESRARAGVAIGYPGISPRWSMARRPDDWVREEGESTLFWGGWQHGVGHRWFRVARGEVDRARISEPIGRDVIRAIDLPIVERPGGPIWQRIPDEAAVVGDRLAGVDTAYPELVLQKVIAVNDTIADRPFLIAAHHTEAGTRTFVFDPVIDGRRLVMGVSGYHLDGLPILFDRDTESLWVADGKALRAISGVLKGRSLRQVSRPVVSSWSRWRTQHPESRLVVGADRSTVSKKL